MNCKKKVFILKEFIYFLLGLILGGTLGWQKNTQLFFFMGAGIILTVFFYLIVINNHKHIEELKRVGKR
jgi:hypothetical protein